MLSKEPGLLTPVFLAVMIPLRHWLNPQRIGKIERQPMQVLVILLAWSVAGLILLREEILNLHFDWEKAVLGLHDSADGAFDPAWDRVLMPFVLLGHYAQLLVAPIHLSIDYGYAVLGWRVSSGDIYLYVGAAVVCGWIAAVICALVPAKPDIICFAFWDWRFLMRWRRM